MLIPHPTGTCTRQEAPSFAWRTSILRDALEIDIHQRRTCVIPYIHERSGLSRAYRCDDQHQPMIKLGGLLDRLIELEKRQEKGDEIPGGIML